jgi:hypothetical protein
MSNEGYSGAKNEKHPSMKRRMEGQDYTGRGIYMVTLAVEGRQPLLGRLAGRADAPAGSSEAPHVELTALGKRVNGEVEHISSYYPQVRVLGKQVMPDHVHFILFVTEQMDVPLGRVVNGFKTGCRRALRELLSAPQISAPQSGTARNTQSGTARNTQSGTAGGTQSGTGGGPGSGPGNGTAGGPGNGTAGGPGSGTAGGPGSGTGGGPGSGTAGGPGSGTAGGAGSGTAGGAGVAWAAAGQQQKGGILWERGYNDRVLYSKNQLQAMIDYIHDNPRRLLAKRSHPQFFCHATVTIGDTLLYAFGNLSLLQTAIRLPVRCSRSLSAEALAAQCAELMERGRAGAVLVSPFISPGEKMIEQKATAEHIAIIKLTENGFAPFFKPSGHYFNLCAAGRLLLLSPFAYHTERTAISRAVCMQLNALAAAICL